MTKTKLYPYKSLAAILLLLTLPLLSGCGETKKQKCLSHLSDLLLGDYTCEISFAVHGEKSDIPGNAEITRSRTATRLDILSPDPYTGMSIEYDVKGLPSSVAVHFQGIDTTIPSAALSRVNSVAVLFADDFASALAKIPGEDIFEYTLSDGSVGYCTSLEYNEAHITLYFSSETDYPISLEYRGDGMNTDIVFDIFSPMIHEA